MKITQWTINSIKFLIILAFNHLIINLKIVWLYNLNKKEKKIIYNIYIYKYILKLIFIKKNY